MLWSGVDEPRKSAIIAVCASILAARKLTTVPRNSPAYIAAIADAVADDVFVGGADYPCGSLF